MHRKILHGLDGSEGSFKALREAINLAKVYNASLYTLTVEELPSNPETVGEIAEEKEGLNEKHKEMMLKVDELAEKEGVEIHPVVLIGHEVKTFWSLLERKVSIS
jgi:nucleotide-binding universal stress UspA family protein